MATYLYAACAELQRAGLHIPATGDARAFLRGLITAVRQQTATRLSLGRGVGSVLLAQPSLFGGSEWEEFVGPRQGHGFERGKEKRYVKKRPHSHAPVETPLFDAPPVVTAPVNEVSVLDAQGVLLPPAEAAPVEEVVPVIDVAPVEPHYTRQQRDRMQEVHNAIREGELRLIGKRNGAGEKLSPGELESTRRAVEQSRAELAELQAGGDSSAPAAESVVDDKGDLKAPGRDYRAEQLQAKIDAKQALYNRLTGQSAHDQAMEQAFPFGVGSPGNASSRRTHKAAYKRMDASIDRAVKAQDVLGDLNSLKAQLAAHRATPKTDEEIAAAGAKQDDVHREMVRRQWLPLKVGDLVDIGGNEPVKIVKKNRKSIVSEGGAKWDISFITGVHKSKIDDVLKSLEEEAAPAPEESVIDAAGDLKPTAPPRTLDDVLAGRDAGEPQGQHKAAQEQRLEASTRGLTDDAMPAPEAASVLDASGMLMAPAASSEPKAESLFSKRLRELRESKEAAPATPLVDQTPQARAENELRREAVLGNLDRNDWYYRDGLRRIGATARRSGNEHVLAFAKIPGEVTRNQLKHLGFRFDPGTKNWTAPAGLETDAFVDARFNAVGPGGLRIPDPGTHPGEAVKAPVAEKSIHELEPGEQTTVNGHGVKRFSPDHYRANIGGKLVKGTKEQVASALGVVADPAPLATPEVANGPALDKVGVAAIVHHAEKNGWHVVHHDEEPFGLRLERDDGRTLTVRKTGPGYTTEVARAVRSAPRGVNALNMEPASILAYEDSRPLRVDGRSLFPGHEMHGVLRNYVHDNPGQAPTATLPDILAAARSVPDAIGGHVNDASKPAWMAHKPLVADVYDAVKGRLGGQSLDDFKAGLLAAHAAGDVVLGRNDLPQAVKDTAAGPGLARVARSEIPHLNATFHVIDTTEATG